MRTAVVFLSAALSMPGASFLHGSSDSDPRLEKDLVYARPAGRPLHLDLYLPSGVEGPFPVIVWLHGGAWVSGSKEDPRAARLTELGYAVASVEYRLLFEAFFPAQIHDVKAAVRWLRANARSYDLDPERFGVWGVSAGGHLASLLGTSGGVAELEGRLGNPGESSRVQAVVSFCGPSDLLELNTFLPAAANDGLPPIFHDLLVRAPELRQRLEQVSPVRYAGSDDPPFLLVHGDRDTVVPVGQSRLLAEALEQAGAEVELAVIAGAGHALWGPRIERLVDDFFARHLKPGPRLRHPQ